MAKSVTYAIELIDSPQNAQRLQKIRDNAMGLDRDFKRIGESFGSSIEAGISRAEIALNRFNLASQKSYQTVGVSSRLGEVGVQPTYSPQQQLGPRRPDRVGEDPLPRKPKSTGPSIPDYSDQLDALGKLPDELGKSAKGLDDVIDRADKFKTKLEELDGQSAKTTTELSKNFRDVVGGIDGAANGIGKLAGGIAFLGVGNENAEKLVKTLLTIKGSVDVFTGLSSTVSSVVQVFSLFKDRSDLSAKSTELLGERKKHLSTNARDLARAIGDELAKSEKAGVVHEDQAAKLRKLATELNNAADAAGRLDNAQDRLGHNAPEVGSSGHTTGKGRTTPRTKRGRGGKGGLLAGIGGMLGYAGVNFVSDQLGDSSGIVDGLGDMAVDNADRFKGLGKYAGRAATVGKAAGVVGSALALGKLGYDVAAGGGTIDPKSGSGRVLGAVGGNAIGGSIDRLLGLDTPAARLAKSFEDLEKATKTYNDRIGKDAKEAPQRELTNDLALMDRKADQTIRDSQLETNARKRAGAVQAGDMSAFDAASGNARDVQSSLNKELSTIREYEGRLAKLGSMAGSAAQQESKALSAMKGVYDDAIGQADVLRRKMMETQQSVIEGVKAEAASRRAINNESIGAAQSRLSLVEKERDLYKTNEQRLEDAAIKFSKLSEGDKASTLNAQRTAQAGGNLSKRQRELLENLNLGSENEVVRKQNLGDARKSGFFDAGFGSFERSQMSGSLGRAREFGDIQRLGESVGVDGDPRKREAQLRALGKRQQALGEAQQEAGSRTGFNESATDKAFKSQAREVKAEVAVRQEFNVKLGLDEAAMIRGISNTINAQLAAVEQRLTNGVKEQLQKDRTERTAKANADAITARNQKPK